MANATLSNDQLKKSVWRYLYLIKIRYDIGPDNDFECPYLRELALISRFWEDFNEDELL